MEPFDSERGGADLTGVSRLDRLRARGGGGVPVPAARPVVPWIALALLLAFTLGLIANPWFERSVRSHLPGFAPTVAPTVADLTALRARVAALESRTMPVASAASAVAANPTAPNERLARVETRVEMLAATAPAMTTRTDKIAADLATLTGRIDATSAATNAALTTATTTADRAQAMLVVAAARRTIDGGGRLGGLEPALRRALGGRAPQQVEAVAALGASPVTLASLRVGLDHLRPALTGVAVVNDASRSWWDSLRDKLSGVVVRESSNDPGAPSSRVDRAAQALAGGNVGGAVAEINALPATLRAKAQGWLTAAARWQAGMRGLAQLDALLLEPPAAGPVVPGAVPAA